MSTTNGKSRAKTQHLFALAKEGDEAAVGQLCSVYGERVRRIIRLRLDQKLRPKFDSVDVVQDALILALDGLVLYGMAIGIHDLDGLGGDRSTNFRNYFGPDRFQDHPGYGGIPRTA